MGPGELVNFNLYDQVIEAGPTWKRKDDSKRQMQAYSMAVRGAQRFCISNDMIDKMLEVGTIENTKRWVNLARLPFRKTWIEFDLHHKILTSLKRGTLHDSVIKTPEHVNDDVPKRMGWLMQELDDQTGLWSMTIFVSTEMVNDAFIGTVPQELVYFLSPEGPSVVLANRPKPWVRPNVIPNLEHVTLGVTDLDEREEAGRPTYVGLPEFENRIQLAWEPVWRIIKGETKQENVIVQTRLLEDAGIIRHAIAVLALLNNAPTIKTYFAPQAGHRYRSGKFIPYFDHNVVTVQLPKGGTRALIARVNVASDERRRHRAHVVRGHYRQIEPGKGPVHCRHEPTLVENGLGICLKCERLIRWVPEHERGDASLGWVYHDYNLASSRRTE